MGRQFEPGRAVEIKSSLYGSGYWIGGRLVLTVAHILAEVGDNCWVRAKQRFGKVEATVVWKAQEEDIALIALPESIDPCDAVVFGQLPESKAGETLKFQMYGYPRWGQTKREGSVEAAGGRQVEGTIYLSDTSPDGWLVLESLRSPKGTVDSGSDWEGNSGAAIVCDGLVIAVQRQHQNPKRPASLEAALLLTVYNDPQWCDLLRQHEIHPEFQTARLEITDNQQLSAIPRLDADTPIKSDNSQRIQVESTQGTVLVGQTVNVYSERTDATAKKPILMVSTPKKDLSQRVEEFKKIRKALDDSKCQDKFDLQNELKIGADEFFKALSRIQPHIVDIAGCEDGIEALFLDDSDSDKLLDSDKLIFELFKLNANSTECVILNGCYLEKQAREIVHHIKFVVAISENLGNRKILSFLEAFYYHLGIGKTIQTSYESGRYSLLRLNTSDADLPEILTKREEEIRRALEAKLAFYDKEIDKNPNNAILWREKADIFKQLNLSEETIESYGKAILIEPDNYGIRTEQGDALEELGMLEEAIAAYNEALELQPEKYEAWLKKGRALVQAGRYEESTEYYEKALELKTASLDVYIILRELASILGKLNQYPESINSYKESLRLKPKYRASSYEKKKMYKKLYFGKR